MEFLFLEGVVNALRNPDDKLCAANAATLIVAADPSRKKLTVRVPDDAPVGMRYGAADVGANKGLPVDAGTTFEDDGGAAGYLYVPAGAAVTVTILEGLQS